MLQLPEGCDPNVPGDCVCPSYMLPASVYHLASADLNPNPNPNPNPNSNPNPNPDPSPRPNPSPNRNPYPKQVYHLPSTLSTSPGGNSSGACSFTRASARTPILEAVSPRTAAFNASLELRGTGLISSDMLGMV